MIQPPPGRIRWAVAPELDASTVSTAFSGLAGRLRVSSFAEANDRLYAAVGQQVYERIDGPAARWRLVYTNPRPGHSETGLRGLTAIPGATGGDALMAAVEGNAARLVRIDPATGGEVTELDLEDFLSRSWGMRVPQCGLDCPSRVARRTRWITLIGGVARDGPEAKLNQLAWRLRAAASR